MAQKVGGVEFDVEVNADGAITAGNRVVKSSKEMQSALEKVESATKSAGGQFSAMGASTSQLSGALQKSSGNLSDVISRHISLGHTITKNNKVIDQNGDEIKSASAALKKYSDQVALLDGKVRASNEAFGRAISSSNKASKATSQLSRNVGMGAVQFGQLAGQIQGGQSALLAFSQQGADIGMLFGPAGMVVGGILSVASAIAGSFIPGLLDGGDATETLTEKLRELNKESELTAAQSKFLAQVEAEEEKQKREKIKALEEEKEELLDTAKNGNTLRDVLVALGASQNGLASTIASKVVPGLENEKKRLIEVNAELDLLNDKTGGAKFDPEANKQAIKSYQQRIASIQNAVTLESSIVQNAASKRKKIEAGLASELDAAAKERRDNQVAQEYAAFQNKLMQFETERESILENEALTETQRQALLNELRTQEQMSVANHNDKLTEIEKNASEKRRKIQQKESMDRLKAVGGMFGNLSALMNTESRKLFEIGKAAAIAGAIVDGIAAAIGSFKVGAKIGGPVVGAAFAAASAAATFAQIQQIKATQFGAAGGGQSIQGGQVVNNQAQQGPQQPDRNISIALTGSNFSGGDVRALIGQINEELGDGATLSTTGG